MNNDFKESINIEKFAAYLDGNLSMDEAQKISQFAEHNSMLRELLNASTVIDDTIAKYTEIDLQLPSLIADSGFELPTIPSDDIVQLVDLSSESGIGFEDIMVAACADVADISFDAGEIGSGNDIAGDGTLTEGQIGNDSVHLNMDNDGIPFDLNMDGQ